MSYNQHLHIVDEKTGVSITTFDDYGNAGLYVSDKNGRSVALVFQKDIGPYVALRRGNSDLPVALTCDGIQIPLKDAPNSPRFLTWEQVFEAAAKIAPPEPA